MENLFITDVALEIGLKAIQAVKDKFTGVIILGVEFETKEDGKIDYKKPIHPQVSCLFHGVSGVHNYRVDVSDPSEPHISLAR